MLERPLHHDGSTGTAADAALHRELYGATLARYRSPFGAEPPPDIWPPVEERFRDPARWTQFDTRGRIVVRRAPVVAALAGVGLAATLTAASDEGSRGLLVVAAVAVLVLVVLVVVAVVVVWAVVRRLVRTGRRPPGRGRTRASWRGGIFVGGSGCGGGGGDGQHDGCGGGGGDSGGDGCGGGGH